jgi:hypothetical protein
MADPLTTAREAGFTVIGHEGTAEEAWAVWRMFIAGSAVPTLRVPDDDPDPHAVEAAWVHITAATGLFDTSGEFLLSVGGEGTSRLPWIRVRTAPDAQILALGLTYGVPEFVATSIDRSVAIGVTSEEDETWILVADDRPTGAP